MWRYFWDLCIPIFFENQTGLKISSRNFVYDNWLREYWRLFDASFLSDTRVKDKTIDSIFVTSTDTKMSRTNRAIIELMKERDNVSQISGRDIRTVTTDIALMTKD